MKTLRNAICLLLLVIILPGCSKVPVDYYTSGTSISLAHYRSMSISNLSYNLFFQIPKNINEPIIAKELIVLESIDQRYDLLIDFRESSDKIVKLELNGEEIVWKFKDDHIIIPRRSIHNGRNEINISFIAGDMSLNRNKEYLYTLLVPDRASTLFPCFDQPNLKASFELKLKIDTSWTSIANNPLVGVEYNDQWKTMYFGEGKPISTYLFAFSAGEFNEIEKTIDGVTMQMLHRETDNELLSSNIDDIFNLHLKAIKWLEEYTGIDYPFDKFGFILIPSFQYGGMEHPGSIYYRASSLFLESNASLNQQLSRAGLIAHETAHIWFGDLVTMDWFDDVWLKEVFAGYMSDKITNPSFPEVDHDLRFLLSRYPAAYSVDRTSGTNPIIQNLSNMKDAGSLYGAIIYNKAPVVMKHLELIMGEEKLKKGLQEYLRKYSYDNAKWDDLVQILDNLSETDLASWSSAWVKLPGRPQINTDINSNGEVLEIAFSETDPSGSGYHWPQNVKTLAIYSDHIDTLLFETSKLPISIQLDIKPEGYLPGFDGIPYGLFRMSSDNIRYTSAIIHEFKDPLARGSFWLNSWESMIENAISPEEFLSILIEQIPLENEILIVNSLRGHISDIFWHYFNSAEREKYFMILEEFTFERVLNESNSSEKLLWFNTYMSIATSSEALNNIYSLWGSIKELEGLTFSESDYIRMSMNLALKGHYKSEKILQEQINRIENSDRKAEYKFIIQAVDSSELGRDSFFSSLKEEINRQHETWVIKSLGYLHHPLFSETSLKYIPESLNLLKEIQETGDIFFPGQWISTTLSGHNSKEAFEMVNIFLIENPDFPPKLKLKILQAYDHLLRKHGYKITK